MVISEYRASNKTDGIFAAAPESELRVEVWHCRTLKLEVWRVLTIPLLLQFKVVVHEQVSHRRLDSQLGVPAARARQGKADNQFSGTETAQWWVWRGPAYGLLTRRYGRIRTAGSPSQSSSSLSGVARGLRRLGRSGTA